MSVGAEFEPTINRISGRLCSSSFIPPPPPLPPRHLSLLPTMELKLTRHPSPLLRDVGPPLSLCGGKCEGEGATGNPGHKGRAVRHDNSWLVFAFFLFPRYPPSLNQGPRQPEQLGRSERRHGGPHESVKWPRTTRQAEWPHPGPKDDIPGQTTTPNNPNPAASTLPITSAHNPPTEGGFEQEPPDQYHDTHPVDCQFGLPPSP